MTRDSVYLEIEAMPGAHISEVARDMVGLRLRLGIPVMCTFNEAQLRCYANTTALEIVEQHHQDLLSLELANTVTKSTK